MPINNIGHFWSLPLFSAGAAPAPKSAGPSPVEAALGEVNPDELTPRTALELLYRLRVLLDDAG